MSLTLARMALQLTIRQSTKTTAVVCLSMSLSASTLFAQESSAKLREPEYQLDLVSIRIPVAPTAQDAVVVPPDNVAAQDNVDTTSDKKKEPIRLPALLIPNTSIQEIGTNSTPEDLVAGRLPGTIPLPFGPDR